MRQELTNIPCGLLLLTGQAGQGEVRRPVGPVAGLRLDRVEIKGNVLCPTVSTGPVPLFQQVLAQIVPGQGAALVFDTGNLWIFHLLHVKADQFAAQAGNRRPPLNLMDPGQGGIDPVLQGGRQPASGPGAIKEAWGAVTQIPTAPATHRPAGGQGLGYLAAAMDQFEQA
jgi:hypothetical protein